MEIFIPPPNSRCLGSAWSFGNENKQLSGRASILSSRGQSCAHQEPIRDRTHQTCHIHENRSHTSVMQTPRGHAKERHSVWGSRFKRHRKHKKRRKKTRKKHRSTQTYSKNGAPLGVRGELPIACPIQAASMRPHSSMSCPRVGLGVCGSTVGYSTRADKSSGELRPKYSLGQSLS